VDLERAKMRLRRLGHWGDSGFMHEKMDDAWIFGGEVGSVDVKKKNLFCFVLFCFVLPIPFMFRCSWPK